MAVPVFSGPYAPQASTFLDAIAFDVSTGWSGAQTFEINTLPPGFTFAGGSTLGGVAGANMVYSIFVRAGNADGFADWEPLVWTVTGQVTERTLYGLPLDWLLVSPTGARAVVDVLESTPMGRQSTWGAGVLKINDTAADGNATTYGAKFRGGQIRLEGLADAYFRATEPGWEIILDTAG